MSDDIDEIWALYADDGAQSLDTVEAALLNLRRDAANRDAVAELFRAMHTFKGNSRLLGLETIEACAHGAEDMVGLVRDEGAELDPELLEMLLEASDRLREMMEMAVTTRRDVDDSISQSITSRMKEKYERMKSLQLSGAAAEVAAPAGEPADETASEDETPQAEETFETAVIFGGPTESLASDPVYLKIFLEVARESLSAISAAISSPHLDGEARTGAIFDAADALNNAATHISIPDWPAVAAEFYGAASDASRLTALLEKAEALYRRASGVDEPEPAWSPEMETTSPAPGRIRLRRPWKLASGR